VPTVADVRVFVHCYFPPRSTHLAGGAQQVIHDLLRGCAERGLRIDVVCPKAEDDDHLLSHPNMRILPVLAESTGAALTPYERQLNLQHLAAAAQVSDVILTVDRAFPLEVDQPVVLLLNNFSYGTEVDGVFSFTWDSVIVPSRYLAAAVAAVAGPELWAGGERPIRVAEPGVDGGHFRPSSTDEALACLDLDVGRYLLFPHRPDPDKGFDVALGAVTLLRRQGSDVRLLVPLPPKSVMAVRERERRYVDQLRERVTKAGLADAVILHPWVPHHLLPAYYSLAECCLVPSRLPEGFGLSVLQSVSCGTPVVATPAGAIPQLLPPDHGMTVVPFNDIGATAAAIVSSASEGDQAVHRGSELIRRHYGADRYVETVIDHLFAATKSEARYTPHAPRPPTAAPWWRDIGEGRRWHDYLKSHATESAAERPNAGGGVGQAVRQAVLAQGLYVGQLADEHQEERIGS
jgi:glycosyltransferase involved in cell wall biosynthesis